MKFFTKRIRKTQCLLETSEHSENENRLNKSEPVSIPLLELLLLWPQSSQYTSYEANVPKFCDNKYYLIFKIQHSNSPPVDLYLNFEILSLKNQV